MASEWDSFQKFTANFFLWVNTHPEAQKYTFKIEDGSIHYTIRVWSRNKEIDLHKTDEKFPENDPRRHETLFKISYFAIGRILVSLKKINIEEFANNLLKSKITVGKLKRYRCVLFPLDKDGKQYEEFILTKRKTSGNKHKLNSNFDFRAMGEPIMPEDGLNHRIKIFTVFKYKGGNWVMNGHVYRFPQAKVHGKRSFIYFSHKMNKGHRNFFATWIYDALTKATFYNKEKVLKYIEDNAPTLIQKIKNKVL